MSKSAASHVNVFGQSLETCCLNPITGYTRSGCCEVPQDDLGNHSVCVEVTEEFLQFSQERGNDLTTPVPEFGFPGLKAGDRWCLCAARWQEALQAGCAPKVYLAATHQAALEHCKLEDLKSHAADLC